MRLGKVALVAHSAFLIAIVAVLVVGSEGRAEPVVSQADEVLRASEQAAAEEATADAYARLAGVYVERGQPGLAQAALDQAVDRDNARWSLAQARVSFARGELNDALMWSRRTESLCANGGACSKREADIATMQVAFFEAMKDAGVEDPLKDRVAASAALAKSTRQVRLAE